MTVDFRPPEEQGHRSKPEALPAADGRRLVLTVMKLAGVLFVLLGAAVLWLRPAFLGPEVSVFIGLGLLLSGVMDFVMARVLGVIWQRAAASGARKISG